MVNVLVPFNVVKVVFAGGIGLLIVIIRTIASVAIIIVLDAAILILSLTRLFIIIGLFYLAKRMMGWKSHRSAR